MVVVVHYSVELMYSESSVPDSVWTFAERDDLVSVEQVLEERMMSLVSVAVAVIVLIVPVVWEVRV